MINIRKIHIQLERTSVDIYYDFICWRLLERRLKTVDVDLSCMFSSRNGFKHVKRSSLESRYKPCLPGDPIQWV